MQLTNQAWTMVGLNVVQILAVIWLLLLTNMSAGWKLVWIMSSIIVMSIGALLAVGVINCMIVGECHSFAWLIVGLFIIYFIMALVAATAYNMNGFKSWIEPKSLLSDPLGTSKTVVVAPPPPPKRRVKHYEYDHDDDEDKEDKRKDLNKWYWDPEKKKYYRVFYSDKYDRYYRKYYDSEKKRWYRTKYASDDGHDSDDEH